MKASGIHMARVVSLQRQPLQCHHHVASQLVCQGRTILNVIKSVHLPFVFYT